MKPKRTRDWIAAGFVVAAVVLFLVLGSGKRYKSLTAEQAVHIMNTRENCLILDVRNPDEYEAGHIPGAVNLPLDDILAGNVEMLTDREQTLLVYCYAGRRSKAAAEKLSELGYRNTYEFGGIVDWTGAIEPPEEESETDSVES